MGFTPVDSELLTGPPMFLTAGICVVAGLTTVAMGVLGRRRRLRRNGLFGIRTSLTLKDEEAWEHIHWKAAFWSVASGLALVVGALLFATASTSDVQFLMLMAGTVAAVVLMLTGTLIAHRDFRARRRTRPGSRRGS